ncbi:MAG: hypothetical protein M0Z82_14805, partial [Actinomycetota bacterium]|nr:hypothetical protein [Actinomycetota bacterium]
MRTLAVLFGLMVIAGLVVMAVAGSPGALGVLLTGGGIVLMIVLGTRVGGRGAHASPRTPAPAPAHSP